MPLPPNPPTCTHAPGALTVAFQLEVAKVLARAVALHALNDDVHHVLLGLGDQLLLFLSKSRHMSFGMRTLPVPRQFSQVSIFLGLL